jgi:hypothetical protein
MAIASKRSLGQQKETVEREGMLKLVKYGSILFPGATNASGGNDRPHVRRSNIPDLKLGSRSLLRSFAKHSCQALHTNKPAGCTVDRRFRSTMDPFSALRSGLPFSTSQEIVSRGCRDSLFDYLSTTSKKASIINIFKGNKATREVKVLTCYPKYQLYLKEVYLSW